MPLVLNRPWANSLTNLSTGSVSNQSGTVQDRNEDLAWDRTKTPRGLPWRPPTKYSRRVDTGYVSTCELACNLRTSTSIVTRSGAADFGGFYFGELSSRPQYLEDRVLNKCLKKLKDGNFNAAVALGESKRTAKLVYDKAQAIAKTVEGSEEELAAMYRKMRRASGPGLAKRLARQIFGRKLEIAYGWVPLLNDVYGAVKEVAERKQYDKRVRVTVKSKATETAIDTVTVSQGVRGITVLVDKQAKTKHQVMCRLDYAQNSELLSDLSRVGLTNPLELAWELIPFSFVVDWFVPVGNYVSLLDSPLGWTFLDGSISTKSEKLIQPLNGRVSPIHGSSVTGFVLPTGKGRQMGFSRKPITSAPMPRPPNINWGKSTSHALNGIALLGSAFMGSKVWR